MELAPGYPQGVGQQNLSVEAGIVESALSQGLLSPEKDFSQTYFTSHLNSTPPSSISPPAH